MSDPPHSVHTRVTSHGQELATFRAEGQTATADRGGPSKQKTEFVWHHANANHTAWVEHITHECLSLSHSKDIREAFNRLWSSLVEEANAMLPGSRHLRPGCVRLQAGDYAESSGGSTEPQVLMLPYLNWDSVKHLSTQHAAVEHFESKTLPSQLLTDYALANSDSSRRLTSFSITSDHPLHPPQALDQYRYPTVPFKHDRFDAHPMPRLTANDETGAKLLTIQQLWLVIPCDHTVITFFPQKEPEADCIEICHAANLEFVIMQQIARTRSVDFACENVTDLAASIVQVVTTHLMFDVATTGLSFRDLYQRATGNLRQQYLSALMTFRHHVSSRVDDLPAETIAENHALNLVLDATALKDELLVIADLLSTQIDVVKDFASSLRRSEAPAGVSSTGSSTTAKTMQRLEGLSTVFKGLRCNVQDTEEDV
ncbi:hypothetical protein LTR10_013996 [Elasticomyces elasticus]|nr:hypothetical protein LTR10_013996 [Elasticomyces elasticus]